ncbi:MAG: DUF2889 domain-containing protein [Acetobacteraceae bacterium]|nr:DUF2889 domain-containing protein [Acetobacteraceae bacterium]
MPLSDPAERNLLHLRDIQLRGYQRKDGLFDIEAHLVDTKSYGFNNEGRGWIEPGEALHGMWIRMTINEEFEVLSCEAASDFTPYDVCPAAAPNFARLAGLKIGPGFVRAVNERVGGIHGCTHLREVIGQVPADAWAPRRQAPGDWAHRACGSRVPRRSRAAWAAHRPERNLPRLTAQRHRASLPLPIHEGA